MTNWTTAHPGGSKHIKKWSKNNGTKLIYPSLWKKYPHGMDNWNNSRNKFSYVGRLGDRMKLINLPSQLSNKAVTDFFSNENNKSSESNNEEPLRDRYDNGLGLGLGLGLGGNPNLVNLDKRSDADVNTEIMLNNLTIAALHRLTGRYVYSIEGLLVKYEAFNLNHPCTPGLRSRWELKELSDCNQTELHGDTYSTLYDLLMESKDKNMYIRDIFFPEEGLNCNADDIESEIEIEVQGSCWQRVHDEHLSIFDVSSISNCL